MTSTLDFHLSKGMDLLLLGIENRANEIESFVQEYDLNDFYPHFVDGLFKSVTAVLNMDRSEMEETVKSLKQLIKILDKLRNKTWTSWIIEPNYDLFTDGKYLNNINLVFFTTILKLVTFLIELIL